jgi:hypothetical protein
VSPSPWLVVVMLGVAITGYAWMMPKKGKSEKEKVFVSEAAYDQLLEDLETENRELVDAVAKFKKEQDVTVEKLGRRIVDMEHQMKTWLEQTPVTVLPLVSSPSITETKSVPVPALKSAKSDLDIEAPVLRSDPYSAVSDEIVLPPTTIRGRYPELLEMHDKGRSVEQIAKVLGLNKGEVQLILQLVRREEQQHA